MRGLHETGWAILQSALEGFATLPIDAPNSQSSIDIWMQNFGITDPASMDWFGRFPFQPEPGTGSSSETTGAEPGTGPRPGEAPTGVTVVVGGRRVEVTDPAVVTTLFAAMQRGDYETAADIVGWLVLGLGDPPSFGPLLPISKGDGTWFENALGGPTSGGDFSLEFDHTYISLDFALGPVAETDHYSVTLDFAYPAAPPAPEYLYTADVLTSGTTLQFRATAPAAEAAVTDIVEQYVAIVGSMGSLGGAEVTYTVTDNGEGLFFVQVFAPDGPFPDWPVAEFTVQNVQSAEGPPLVRPAPQLPVEAGAQSVVTQTSEGGAPLPTHRFGADIEGGQINVHGFDILRHAEDTDAQFYGVVAEELDANNDFLDTGGATGSYSLEISFDENVEGEIDNPVPGWDYTRLTVTRVYDSGERVTETYILKEVATFEQHEVHFIPVSNLDLSGDTGLGDIDGTYQGAASDLSGKTLTITSNGGVAITVIDAGDNFDSSSSTQRSVGAVTIDGVTYGDGSQVSANWDIVVTDLNTGIAYTAVGISLGDDPTQLAGIAFIGEAPPEGARLRFTDAPVSDRPGIPTYDGLATLDVQTPSDPGEPVTIEVEVAPRARYLWDNAESDSADGLISGDTATERWEDMRVERVSLFWGGLLQMYGADLPNWTPQEVLAFVLSTYQGEAGSGLGAIDDATWQAFFDENFDVDGNFTGKLDASGNATGDVDLSMFEGSDAGDVKSAFEDASLLFFSLQQHDQQPSQTDQNHRGSETRDLSRALFVPESVAEADALFATALRGEALGTGMSSFVFAGDTWQDFFVTGLSDLDSIINGHFSEEDLNNHALTKATLWVGTDIIAEYEGSDNEQWNEYWTGPSAEGLDSPTLADDYKVYEVSYTRDGQTYHSLVDEATYLALQQEHRDGKIVLDTNGIDEIATDSAVGWSFAYLDENGELQHFDGGGIFGAGKVDELVEKHNAGKIVILAPQVTDHATLKMFWSQKALALYDAIRVPEYDADGNMISGADSTTRLAHAFVIMKEYYQPATETESFKDRGGHDQTGTRLEPLLRTDAVVTTPQMTDAEAREIMFTALGIDMDSQPDLFAVLLEQGGVSNIADVAGHWAQRQHHHPDHDSLFGGHGNKEQANHAYDIVSAALARRGRQTGGIDMARDDTNHDITVGRVIDGLADVAIILSLGTDAAFVTGVRVTLGEAGIEATETELVPLLRQGAAGAATDAAEGGTFQLGGATVRYSAAEYAAAQLTVESGASGATGTTVLAQIASLAGAGWDVVSQLGAEFGAGAFAYTTIGAAGFKVVEMADTGLMIVREVVPGDVEGPTSSTGITPYEALRAVFIAHQITEAYHHGGAEAATNVLLSHGLRPDAGMVLEVLQYLDGDVRIAVEGQLMARADTHLEAFEQVIGAADLDDPATFAEIVSLLDGAPPAAASAALEYIRNTHGEAAAVMVMQEMAPGQVAKILVHDMALSLYEVRDGGRSASGLPANVTTFAALGEIDPEQAGLILTAVGNEDIEVGGYLLLKLARTNGFEAVSELLVHTDSVEAAELMSEALKIEGNGRTSWDPGEESVVLDVSVELLNDGNELGMSTKVNATFAAFIVLQPTLTLSAEEELINEASQSNLVEISSLLGDPFSFLDALGGDQDALAVAAEGLERMGVDEAADAIVGYFGGGGDGDGGGGDVPPPSSSPLGGLIREVDDRFAGRLITTLNEKSPETVVDLIINETDPDNPLGLYREENLLDWFKYLGPEDAGRVAQLVNLELTRRGRTEGNAWEEANRDPFNTIVNEYLENLPARHAAQFLAELSPEEAAAYLDALNPAQAAAILEEMVNSGDTEKVGAILGHMAETSPARAAEVLRHMTFSGAARALEALETLRAQDPSSNLPGAKAILDEMPEADAAAILSRMEESTAVNIFAQTGSGEDYNRMFRIHNLMDNSGNQNAVRQAGIPGGPAGGVDPDAGIVDEDDVDDFEVPIYMSDGRGGHISGYGGTLEEEPHWPFVVAEVQNPEGDQIVTAGHRLLVVGQDQNGSYFIPVDEDGNIIPGYVIYYNPDNQTFVAQRAPEGFSPTFIAPGPLNPIHVGEMGVSADDFAAQFEANMQGVAHFPQVTAPTVGNSASTVNWGQWNFPDPGPNPLPIIRQLIAEFQTTPPDARSANYLAFLLDRLGPGEANALTLDERFQIMQVVIPNQATLSGHVLEILGMRPADPAGFVPGPRLPQGTVLDFVDGQISQIADIIYDQFEDILSRTTPLSEQEATVFIEDLVRVMAEFYGMPVPEVRFYSSESSSGFYSEATTFSQATISINRSHFELILSDPIQAVFVIVHEMTHGYQDRLRRERPTDQDAPEWGLYWLDYFGTAANRQHPSSSGSTTESAYYYRAMHEVHAFYVEEGVTIALVDRLNERNGSDMVYFYLRPGDGTTLILTVRTQPQPYEPDPSDPPPPV